MKTIKIFIIALIVGILLYEISHGEAFKPDAKELPEIKPYTYTLTYTMEQRLFAVSRHYSHYQRNLNWYKNKRQKLGL
jgi:hypothetical protein